eukprot:CAMPEP_0202979074 /NCGR_PEP_ID=MMETSP1396-20130829/85326_1 /ASSEMBLY_ACC=CAM_ASM_000872 /TAXON_ID= /ORGANISM="Pseudokeronopsis sp., Strain Brazil" /LENGTH=80 /DNA_ID=CAMNT_0049718337 /DNA_START=79 /DNA_END=318 /DNA_ORIENTATION=-
MAARGTSAFMMKRPCLVLVLVTVPLRLTNWPMMACWHSTGTVTSTSITGSNIEGLAFSYASVKEYLVAIPKAREEESTTW